MITFYAPLGPSLTASLVVHLAALGLVAAGAGTARDNAPRTLRIDAPLELVLATSPPQTVQREGSPPLFDVPATVHAPAPRHPAHAAADRVPTVTVDDRVPRARLAAAFEGGPLAEFPLEVESPVVLPGKLAVRYPTAAREERREGSVLAWAIVDRHGTVEATSVVEGEPDFAAAAQSALAAARFVPARYGGAPVRFYVTLEFGFRLDADSDRR